MGEEYVSVKRLAEIINMDRSHAHRYIKKLGIKPQKRRMADSNNQLANTVTEDEAALIIKQRKTTGFTAERIPVTTECGVFYIIQLVPELDHRRIKLGFAIDLNDRLTQHRTSAPTAEVVKYWSCKRLWEKTVMDCLTSVSCRHILNEVFECEALNELIAWGDILFDILPDPNVACELSEHSPYSQVRLKLRLPQ